ncbi:MAG TPA: metallophosphoesterase [Steroidobacteraceae bacterium]|nr:metallophosphoesterase [Steroidobacteraceae bacterium]
MRRLLLLALLACLPLAPAGADGAYRITGARRVVAFADVHGAYDSLVSLLRSQGVVDGALRWSGGDAQLVSLGDLVDRGPDSRKVLDLLMRLEGEARAAGGAVHVVLGNHEVMNIVGDLRYVSAEEYAAFAGREDDALREAAWQKALEREPGLDRAAFDARFPSGWFAHRQAFSPAGTYGAWLLARPFVLVIDDTAFAHGGLPPLVAELGLDAANAALHGQLAAYLEAWPASATALPALAPDEFLERPEALLAAGAAEQSAAIAGLQEAPAFTTAGPTWYRGQALCHPFIEDENLAAALSRLGAKRLVVGHTVTTTRRVSSRFDGRVILLDTGMLASAYQGRPAALVLEGGRVGAAYADRPGELVPPEAVPRAIGARPAGLDDDALAAWLGAAEIVGGENLPTGITQPRRITLRKDGVELRAVAKQLSTDFGAGHGTQSLNEGDRFEYDVAAYQLDRLLGLDMVPVTIARKVDGRMSAVQFWVEGSINARQMLEAKLAPDGWCPVEPQYNLMNVFDVLVHNTDRTQENLLLTRDWHVVLIDHSRAFTLKQGPPRLLYQKPIELSPAFEARLAALDAASLERALGPWLHKRQVAAILKRRDRLVREH